MVKVSCYRYCSMFDPWSGVFEAGRIYRVSTDRVYDMLVPNLNLILRMLNTYFLRQERSAWVTNCSYPGITDFFFVLPDAGCELKESAEASAFNDYVSGIFGEPSRLFIMGGVCCGC